MRQLLQESGHFPVNFLRPLDVHSTKQEQIPQECGCHHFRHSWHKKWFLEICAIFANNPWPWHQRNLNLVVRTNWEKKKRTVDHPADTTTLAPGPQEHSNCEMPGHSVPSHDSPTKVKDLENNLSHLLGQIHTIWLCWRCADQMWSLLLVSRARPSTLLRLNMSVSSRQDVRHHGSALGRECQVRIVAK